MKSLLDPVFIYCEGIYWNKKHPPYDIGLYPVSGKQVKLESCAVGSRCQYVDNDNCYCGSGNKTSVMLICIGAS